MSPIQVLVNNLLYDVSQAGIPLDDVDEEYLRDAPAVGIQKHSQFHGGDWADHSIFDYATFILMLYFFGCLSRLRQAGGDGAAGKSYYESLFHTGWFVESLLTQTLIVHIIRTFLASPLYKVSPAHSSCLTTVTGDDRGRRSCPICLMPELFRLCASAGQLIGYGSQDFFFAIRCITHIG